MIRKSVHLRRWRRARRLKHCQPDWRSILAKDADAWVQALGAADGPKVLVATNVGSHLPGTVLESLLAASLTLRRARVHFLLCDGILPACQDCVRGMTLTEREMVFHGPQGRLCKSCFDHAWRALAPMGLTLHRFGDLVGDFDRQRAAELADTLSLEEIRGFHWEGASLGEHALAGTLRFYARGTLSETPNQARVLRRYLHAALLTHMAVKRLQEKENFSVALFHHGIYVPQGVVGEFCRNNGIRVVNWNPAYRKKCFIFSHGDTYHHTLMKEPTAMWESIPWSDTLDRRTMDYLKSRGQGTNDWIWFHDKPLEDLARIARLTGVDYTKPCIGLLTNVFWDAQLHYPANAFANMLEWMIETIAYFSRRPDLQLLIRIHPAEVRGAIPSGQPIEAEIRRVFPRLPANVFVIPPRSPISTYTAMTPCNAVIIYGTKTGIELASLGIPVIVAGEAWIRNKRITLDASSREDYFHILDTLPLPGRMDEARIARARRYAFHFFFRRMIPIDAIAQCQGWPPYRLDITGLDALQPGASRGLDVVTEGILHRQEFFFPAENESF